MWYAAPLRWFVYQQDYLWFVLALGSLALLIACVRLRGAVGTLRVAWAVGAFGLLTSAIAISQLVTSVSVQPLTAPWLWWDLAMGGTYAASSGLVWLQVAREQRRVALRVGACAVAISALAMAVFRQASPHFGAWVGAGIALSGALAAWANVDRLARLGLSLWTGAIFVGTAGPLAEVFDEPHRMTEVSGFGPVTAALGIGAVAAMLAALYRRARAAAHAVDPEDRGELVQLARTLGVWLAIGMVAASIMARWARSDFEQSLKSRGQLSVQLLDRAVLERALSPEFRIDRVDRLRTHSGGRVILQATSPYLGSGVVTPLSAALSRIQEANADVSLAQLLTIRNDWLVSFCLPQFYPGSAADLGVFGHPDAATEELWASRDAAVIGPTNFYYGDVIQARLPVRSADGRMLAWLALDVSIARWMQAQVQARLLAFGIIALGAGVLVLNWRHRQRERLGEAAKREAAAAAAANQLKTAFLAKVSHELRTPIQSLLGFSELLRQHVAADPKARSWLGSLRQQGELMTRLVNDLIDLSAVEAGAFQLVAKTISPEEIVSQTVESFRPRAESKGLSLACFIDPATPAWVTADGERIRQIVTNLVSNAVKYTARGHVIVTLRSMPAATPGSLRLALTVQDSGPGITTAEQARLFTPFSRLPSAAATEGTGLGLALSAALCRAMGGALTLQSDGCTGSTFTAQWLAQPAEAEPLRPTETLVPLLRGKKVLVVDDNPLVRELFVSFLTEQGAMCASSANAVEALNQVRDGLFETIVLDLALPDADGADLAPRLREESVCPVRIVGVSAHAATSDRARALGCGMNAFLIKPVPLRELAAAIADAAPSELPPVRAFRSADKVRHKLTQQFRHELPGQRSELETAVRQHNWIRVGELAHYLKNSAVVVCDESLFAVCSQLEAAAGASDETLVRQQARLCLAALERWQA